MKRKISSPKKLQKPQEETLDKLTQLEKYIQDYRGMVSITPQDLVNFKSLSKLSTNAYSIVQTVIHHKRDSHPLATDPVRQIAI